MLYRSCYHIPLLVQHCSTQFHIKSSLKHHPKNNGRSVHVKPFHCVIKLLPSCRWGDSSFAKTSFSSGEKTTRWSVGPRRCRCLGQQMCDSLLRTVRDRAHFRTPERPPQPFDAWGSSSGQILTQKNGFQLTKSTTGLSSTHSVTVSVTF